MSLKITIIGSLPELFQLENCILRASLSAIFLDAEKAVQPGQEGQFDENQEIATVQVEESQWPNIQQILIDNGFHIGTAQDSSLNHLGIPIVTGTTFALSGSGHKGPVC